MKRTFCDPAFEAGFESTLAHLVRQTANGEPLDDLTVVAVASGLETAVREGHRAALALAAKSLRAAILGDDGASPGRTGRLWVLGIVAGLGANRAEVPKLVPEPPDGTDTTDASGVQPRTTITTSVQGRRS